ncbi:MAG: hypothetical protein ABI467_24130 [Kofleriaceae bacterium]
MHRLAIAILGAALAACSSSPKSAESTMPASGSAAAAPAAAGASCAEAADHTIDLLSKAQPDAPPDVIKKIRDTLAGHCDQDHWSAASRDCFAHMQTKEQGDHCEDGLSQAQKDSLMKEAPSEAGSSRGPHKGGDPEDGGE